MFNTHRSCVHLLSFSIIVGMREQKSGFQSNYFPFIMETEIETSQLGTFPTHAQINPPLALALTFEPGIWYQWLTDHLGQFRVPLGLASFQR